MASTQIFSVEAREVRRDPRARGDVERARGQRRSGRDARADARSPAQARQEEEMSDSSHFKDFDVDVLYGGKPETLPIKAPNLQAALNYAEYLLQRRRKKPDTRVLGGRERRKK